MNQRWWKELIQPETLKVTLPFGRTVVWILMILVLFLGFTEVLLRIEIIQTILPTPDYGSNNLQFGIKVNKLDQYIKQQGAIDCIFIGGSMVSQGIDPVSFSNGYKKNGGNDIKVFNFGLGGMPASSFDDIASFLINRYHPRILILGISPIEFSETIHNAFGSTYSTPWVQYKAGNKFSTEGWLFEYSYTKRYMDRIRYWDLDYRRSIEDWYLAESISIFTPQGWHHRLEEVHGAPTPGEKNLYTNEYVMHQGGHEHFLRLLNLNMGDTQLLIFEEPLHPNLLQNAKEEIYTQKFLNTIKGDIYTSGKHLLLSYSDTTGKKIAMANDNWRDGIHLNNNGAVIFSDWLGTQYASVIKQQ